MKKLNNSTVLSIMASIIALASLSASIYQGYETRKYYRLSVKPSLDFTINVGYEANRIGLYLSNKGLGPGIVKELLIKINGNWFPLQSPDDFKKAIQALNLNEPLMEWGAWAEGTPILPSEELILLRGLSNNNDDKKNENIRLALKNVDLMVHYESIYGEKFVHRTHNKK